MYTEKGATIKETWMKRTELQGRKEGREGERGRWRTEDLEKRRGVARWRFEGLKVERRADQLGLIWFNLGFDGTELSFPTSVY